MSRRVVLAVLVVGALVVAAIFVARRGPESAAAIAVYARLSNEDTPWPRPLLFLIESFHLGTHRAMPVRVREVLGVGPHGPYAVEFTQEGDLPAILRMWPVEPKTTTLTLRAENDIGPLETSVALDTRTDSGEILSSEPDLGWPIRVGCGGFRLLLLSEMGVPEVGVEGQVLVLIWPRPPGRTEVFLGMGSEGTRLTIEPWGGAIGTLRPRTFRSIARVAVRGEGTGCETHVVTTAAARRTWIRDLAVESLAEGRYRLRASVTTKVERLIALLAPRTDAAKLGPLLDARTIRVREGRAEAVFEVARPGVYQVRFSDDPLTIGSGARGTDAIVAVGDEREADPLIEAWRIGVGAEEIPDIARPFVLAALSAASPIVLTQVSNTSDQARAAWDERRNRRDVALLTVLTLFLSGLVVLMGVEVIRGHRKALRLEEALDSTRGGGMRTWGRLLPAVLVGGVVLAAIAALVLVLRTL